MCEAISDAIPTSNIGLLSRAASSSACSVENAAICYTGRTQRGLRVHHAICQLRPRVRHTSDLGDLYKNAYTDRPICRLQRRLAWTNEPSIRSGPEFIDRMGTFEVYLCRCDVCDGSLVVTSLVAGQLQPASVLIAYRLGQTNGRIAVSLNAPYGGG